MWCLFVLGMDNSVCPGLFGGAGSRAKALKSKWDEAAVPVDAHTQRGKTCGLRSPDRRSEQSETQFVVLLVLGVVFSSALTIVASFVCGFIGFAIVDHESQVEYENSNNEDIKQ